MNRVWNALRWGLAGLACLWLALCTAVGPIYRGDGSIADFSWVNWVVLLATFAVYGGIVVILSRLRNVIAAAESVRRPVPVEPSRPRKAPHAFTAVIYACTDRWWKLWLILLIGWLWALVTLLSAFGADVFSQIGEFTSEWKQLHGGTPAYLTGDGVVNAIMDVYPTAHYLWPATPTFLTNQHNILLTLLYGSVGFGSRTLTGSADAGLVLLSAAQYVFAAFCCAATLHRALNLPFLKRDDGHAAVTAHPSSAIARVALIVLLLNPTVAFSAISLTKSPLFAFTFLWWFGIWYELHLTSRNDGIGADAPGPGPSRWFGTSARTATAFALSTILLLASAKYGLYVVALMLVLGLLADRRRWRLFAVALLLPLLVFQGALTACISSGMIIDGDPIEGKGVQLQQIGRVAQRDAGNIPDSAREMLDPILDLDAAAEAYFPDDADRMKSSGGNEDKTVVYRWKTVTAEDMKGFNQAWLEIGLANPVLYIDGLLSKCYGYFDVADPPYTSAAYYIDNGQIATHSAFLDGWLGGARHAVSGFVNAWGSIPVLGWPLHGNFWTVLTLLVGAAEVVTRRWRALAFHLPLLLLMGVMVTAPANNFDRHMLPLIFVFGVLALQYLRESRPSDEDRSGVN